MARYARYQKKRPSEKGASSLEEFVKLDDALSFSRAADRALKVVHTFVNKEDSLDSFYSNLLSKSLVLPFNEIFDRIQLHKL